MNIEAKYLEKFTWTRNILSENSLVLALQSWECSSKIANDSCLYYTALIRIWVPNFFNSTENVLRKQIREKRYLSWDIDCGGLRSK